MAEVREEIKTSLKASMGKAVNSLKRQLSKVRTGRASVNTLDGITVDYYGTPTPIQQMAQVSTPEARLLQIQPFDKAMVPQIEKAILNANLGPTPSNDGNLIRIPFPPITGERRMQEVKKIKKLGEEAKITIRTLRREENDVAKKSGKRERDL